MRLPNNYIEAVKQIAKLKIFCIILFGLGIIIGLAVMLAIFNII